MQRLVTSHVSAPPSQVFEIISDLGTYPEWLDLVAAANPADDNDGQPAWLVTIRAKIGPLARSKKLRMVRTTADATSERSLARFERQELDGRDHAAWVLEASVSSQGEQASTVEMKLSYEGSLWTAPLEPILSRFIDQGGEQLDAYARR